eukprot:m.338004 g.338004  ORF g.338004 m.338004 type:complete len:480 (-) comp18288_c0_seq1:142-1581(-)
MFANSNMRLVVASSASAKRFLTTPPRIKASPMVYISGEGMTRYTMDLIIHRWIKPHINTSSWSFFDLSCQNRDASDDAILQQAVHAGREVGAIFKEPTVTPTEKQKFAMGISRNLDSPNRAFRQGWNGVTISRDTIHIKGLNLGYKRPVLFDRHAIGGEYAAQYRFVGRGEVETIFEPADGSEKITVDSRKLTDSSQAVVTYRNPLHNIPDLAHHFFSRCLKAGVTPYVVTKKTVFKWQEEFWVRMKDVFDEHYKKKFADQGLLATTGGELPHLISDAATMQLIRWTDGGFGMVAHNYDGDMLTDEMSQVHNSPGMSTSALIGKREDGIKIMAYGATHGSASDLWDDHLDKQETSLNPVAMVTALTGAMRHASTLEGTDSGIHDFTGLLMETMFEAFSQGKGTRDLCGPGGLTTEEHIDYVAGALNDKLVKLRDWNDMEKNIDMEKIQEIFDQLEKTENGGITEYEFQKGLALMKKHGM